MKYFVDRAGNYLGGWSDGGPDGGIEVPSAPEYASRTWNFQDSVWNPAPPLTEEEMKISEIEQDKKYLADTDWIVAKIGEASLTGQDTIALLEQYSFQLQERESARIRIRINEGRA